MLRVLLLRLCSVPTGPSRLSGRRCGVLRADPANRGLAGEHARQHYRMVVPARHNGCHTDGARARSRSRMGGRARVDGDRLHPQFAPLRANPLPLYRPLLSRDDLAGDVGWRRHCVLDIYGWIALGIVALGGSGLIWLVTERSWGRFSPGEGRNG
jgi:hypothetical protein